MNGNDPIQEPTAAGGAYYGDAGTRVNDTAAGAGYDPTGNTGPGPGYGNGAPPPPPYAYAPAPPPTGAPNPGLAALLGFIPGVGAMYNGQFAKGLAHIVIFAIFVSLSDHVNGIFGLLVAGWIFYMVFDAYQTARARRDGLVAPDPFGMNNIGERFGVHGNPAWNDFVARPAAGTQESAASAAADAPPYATSVPNADAPANPGSAAYAAYQAPATTAGSYPPPATPYYDPAAYTAAAYASAYPAGSGPYATPYSPNAVPPYQPGYAAGSASAVPPFMPPPMTPPRVGSGIPTGAFWLVGLGVLALIGSLAHSVYWSGRVVSTFSLLLIGIVLLVARTVAAHRQYPAGSAAYNWNMLRQNRAGVLVFVAGLLQMLDGLHVAYWRTTWPYLLIVAGLYQVLDRTLYNRMLAESPFAVAQPVVTPVRGTAVVAETSAISTEEEVR